MRPPSVCRPAVGASAPKGTCRWWSPHSRQVVRAALKYNSYRAAGRILCRRLKYATGYCKWQSGLAATIHWDSALCRSDSSLPLLTTLHSGNLRLPGPLVGKHLVVLPVSMGWCARAMMPPCGLGRRSLGRFACFKVWASYHNRSSVVLTKLAEGPAVIGFKLG